VASSRKMATASQAGWQSLRRAVQIPESQAEVVQRGREIAPAYPDAAAASRTSPPAGPGPGPHRPCADPAACLRHVSYISCRAPAASPCRRHPRPDCSSHGPATPVTPAPPAPGRATGSWGTGGLTRLRFHDHELVLDHGTPSACPPARSSVITRPTVITALQAAPRRAQPCQAPAIPYGNCPTSTGLPAVLLPVLNFCPRQLPTCRPAPLASRAAGSGLVADGVRWRRMVGREARSC
jgi:hypothetical protein